MNPKQPHPENPADGVVTCGQNSYLDRPLPGQLWVFSICLHELPQDCATFFSLKVFPKLYTFQDLKNSRFTLAWSNEWDTRQFWLAEDSRQLRENIDEMEICHWCSMRFRVSQKDRENQCPEDLQRQCGTKVVKSSPQFPSRKVHFRARHTCLWNFLGV